jgi:serine/threonine-protein kinase RIO1
MVSRVEKHNPLKSGAIAQKRAALKGETSGRTTEIKELTFETVRKDAIQYGLATDVTYQINAVKAYRLWQSSHKMSKKKGYVAQGTSKRTHFILGMMEDLAVMEYDYLMNCFRAGVHVPTPIGRVGNYLTMRFIGDGTQPAPQLKDVHLENPEKVLDQILDDYLLMYSKAHYVHGDLSKYNILWWQERPWLIDIPQAVIVNKWSDMLKVEKLLIRDIKNVLAHFETYDIYRDPDHILEVFLTEYIPENLKNYRELASEGIELL